MFTFTFNIRQAFPSTGDLNSAAVDTQINGLTYVYASTPREVENLVTREFHADPNLHKNANVELIGDFTTGGSPTVTFDWSWKWKAPKTLEDPSGGWRNSCSVCHSINAGSLHIANYSQVCTIRSARTSAANTSQFLLLGPK